MYNTSQIADFLGTSRQNINHYIRQGYLRAIMVDGNYEITQADYFSFRDEYYDTNKRHKKRGIAKKLSDEQISMISNIITDIKNKKMSFDNFKEKYKDKENIIPQIQDFIIYKRDFCIKEDNKNGMKYTDLSYKYGLAEVTIKGIVNPKSKEDF